MGFFSFSHLKIRYKSLWLFRIVKKHSVHGGYTYSYACRKLQQKPRVEHIVRSKHLKQDQNLMSSSGSVAKSLI